MSTLATDNFNRADGPLGANWTSQVGNLGVVSNTCQADAGGSDQRAFYSGVTFPNDQWAQASYLGLTTYSGVLIRMSGTGASQNGYEMVTNHLDQTYLVRIDAGVPTTLTTSPAVPTAGDAMYIEMQVTTIVVKLAGVTVITWTDPNYSAGSPGVVAAANGILDDFLAGDFGGGGSTINVSIALANAVALAQSGPLTLPGTLALGTKGGVNEGNGLGMTFSSALATVAAMAAAAGFAVTQALSLALSTALAASTQKALNVDNVTLGGKAAVADTATMGLAGTSALGSRASVTATATDIVNGSLALAVSSLLSGFAGFANIGTVALAGKSALAVSFQVALNLAVTLVDAAAVSESARLDAVASIVAALTSACQAAATSALSASTPLGASPAVSTQAGFQLTAMLQLLVAGQLEASAAANLGAGPQTIHLIAAALRQAALTDIVVTSAGFTDETIN